MADHQFSVGDLVTLNWQPTGLPAKSNAYMIKSQLPPLGVELQYRIKSTNEPYERVVTEHQLTKVMSSLEVEAVS